MFISEPYLHIFIFVTSDNGQQILVRRSLPPKNLNPTMDPAKIAKLQAAAVANRIGEFLSCGRVGIIDLLLT